MFDNLALFSSSIFSVRMDAAWSYDRRIGRYRDERGKFLGKEAVGKLVDSRIDQLEANLRRYTRMLADGNLTLDQWQGSVREAIKNAHIQAALIGYGGKDEMGPAEYGRIGQRLRAEYTYLQGFARDLLDGRISNPMALARVGLYAQSVRGSYWQGTELRQQQQGFSLMKRKLDGQAQHCQDCLDYAARGIVPIGTLPLPGQRCACRARCRCSIEYFRQQAPVVPV
jgi:hypothetical protein